MPICGSSNIRTPSTRARSERRRFSLELQVFLLNFLTLLFVRSRKGHRRSDVLPHCSLELLDVRRCPASTKLTEHVVNLLPASHQVLLRLLLDETRLQVVTATELSKLLQRILYGTHPLLRLVCRRLIQWRWNGSWTNSARWQPYSDSPRTPTVAVAVTVIVVAWCVWITATQPCWRRTRCEEECCCSTSGDP